MHHPPSDDINVSIASACLSAVSPRLCRLLEHNHCLSYQTLLRFNFAVVCLHLPPNRNEVAHVQPMLNHWRQSDVANGQMRGRNRDGNAMMKPLLIARQLDLPPASMPSN